MPSESSSPFARPRTLVFFGISGAGKGTQVDLLKKYLETHDSDRHVLHFDMGQGLREVAGTPTFFGNKVKSILESGGLVPSFVASHVLTDYLGKYFRAEDHLLIDGTPRRVAQASALDAQLHFYDRQDYEIVFLNLSEESAHKRLALRLRKDDTSDAITKRLEWYKEHVVPAFELLASRGRKVHMIDGEPSIEDIHKNILTSLGLPL